MSPDDAVAAATVGPEHVPGAVYVTRPSLPPFDDFVDGLRGIWDSRTLTNRGPLHEELTERVRTYLGVERVVLFSSGHQALELTLQTLPRGGEVITTPFSFASTTHAIVRSGLTPVFCDVHADDGNLDEEILESLVTPRTCAILPVHAYGNPCRVVEIGAVAGRHGLRLFYDGAQAFGIEVGGRSIAQWGEATMFSFHATKVFHTIEGGALATSDHDLADLLELARNFGIASADDVVMVGSNGKLNEIQALLGLLNLKALDGDVESRARAADLYKKSLADIAGIDFLARPFEGRANSSFFPIVVNETVTGVSREEIFALAQRSNIHLRKYFAPVIPDYACYRGQWPCEIPVARHLAENVLTLPLWAGMPTEVIERTCAVFAEACSRG